MKKTYLYALISIFFWSTVSAITKLLLSSYDNFQVLWISAFFAASFLIVLNVVTGQIKLLKNYKPKDYALSLLAGLPGTFFYYLFFYAGTDLMPASQAFIVNYTWPIMSIVFAKCKIINYFIQGKIRNFILQFVINIIFEFITSHFCCPP